MTPEAEIKFDESRPYEPNQSMPANVEAERLCLGVVILDNGLAPQLVGETVGDDYYSSKNRLIFQAIKRLVEKGRAIDPLSIQEQLRLIGALNDAGGPAYLASVFDGVPRFSNIDNYIRIIKDRSLKRRLIKEANWVMKEAFADDTEGETLLRSLADRIQDAEQRAFVSDLVTSAEASQQAAANLEEQWARKDGLLGLPTGLPRLDKILLGLQRGKLYTLAAPTSDGKTALALNIAWNAATGPGERFLKRKPVVLFITLEMEPDELQHRLWARIANVALDKLLIGDLTPEELQRVSEAVRATASITIDFNDGRQNITRRGLGARMQRVRRKYGFLDLVVIDYLHLMDVEDEDYTDNEHLRLSKLSRGNKRFARMFNTPILCLSQLNRKPTGEAARDPLLSDLRGSGSIEQDSDTVMFIGRENYKDPEDVGRKIIVAKNRGGRKGKVPATFIGARQLFVEAYREEQPKAAPTGRQWAGDFVGNDEGAEQ